MFLVNIYEFICCLITFLFGMIFVAFFILSERKFLGYIQIRKGPNKVGLAGLLQSFADLLKLVIKYKVYYFQNRSWFCWLGVFLFVLVCVSYCVFLSSSYSGFSKEWALLWSLCISSIGGYGVLCVGWGSYCKYALMSSMRCCFTIISFEALFMCCVIQCSVINEDYSVESLLDNLWLYGFVSPLLFVLWLAALLSECGRTPFDYLEAESEMVSGINVEYSSVPFTCIFACEYFIMFILSWLTSVMFFGGAAVWPVTMFILFLFIWSRGTFPRARYDFFVSLMWEWSLLVAVFSFMVVI